MILSMRHGDPPQYDAKPRFSHGYIARVLGAKENTISRYLAKFYKNHDIQILTTNLRQWQKKLGEMPDEESKQY